MSRDSRGYKDNWRAVIPVLEFAASCLEFARSAPQNAAVDVE